MTNQPAPDARPNALHRRLTVALAAAPDRARLADLLVGDVQGADPSPLVRSEDLWTAADGLSRSRAADRAELRTRLEGVAARSLHDRDTAASRLESLVSWQRTLREGADWADGLVHDLDGPLGAVDRARGVLDARIADHKAAEAALQRVLEQRHAAARAIEEADRELGDVATSGMDESGLRRELEAAGRAVQAAREAHEAALDQLAECNLERAQLELRLADLGGTPAAERPAGPDPEVVAAVRASLEAFQLAAMGAGPDPQATALADAWGDLSADLAEHGDALGARPSEAELEAARARVAATAAAVDALDAAQRSLSPEDRAALDAAHAEVQDAEERTERRVGAAAARKRLAEARAHEDALLEQHGFDSYLDVVLSGGRPRTDEPARLAADRDHLDAVQALQALEQAGAPSPELVYLESERERLHAHIVELLGVDPGDHPVDLLRRHPAVPPTAVQALLADLARADVVPVGTSAEEAAERFLAEHGSVLEHHEQAERSAGQRQVERAAVEARLAALEAEASQAQSEVDRTAEELQMAERSVSAFEGELSVRAGEDKARLQRFAAAEQLRAQVEAVNASLAAAEASAQDQLEAAAVAVGEAEAGYDRAAEAVADLARRARQLAEELPIDQRPEGEPLATLPLLVDALRSHAEVLQPELDAAEMAFTDAVAQLDDATAAVRLAGAADDGPQPDDLVEGMTDLLAARAEGTVLVLDEPFVGVDETTRARLLEVVLEGSSGRQVALLTEDAEVLGWAIELPVDVAMAVPADALLARMRPTTTVDLAASDTSPDADRPAADHVDPEPTDTDPTPAPTARRWAGQR
jgi:hypothetical protein